MLLNRTGGSVLDPRFHGTHKPRMTPRRRGPAWSRLPSPRYRRIILHMVEQLAGRKPPFDFGSNKLAAQLRRSAALKGQRHSGCRRMPARRPRRLLRAGRLLRPGRPVFAELIGRPMAFGATCRRQALPIDPALHPQTHADGYRRRATDCLRPDGSSCNADAATRGRCPSTPAPMPFCPWRSPRPLPSER